MAKRIHECREGQVVGIYDSDRQKACIRIRARYEEVSVGAESETKYVTIIADKWDPETASWMPEEVRFKDREVGGMWRAVYPVKNLPVTNTVER